MSTHISRVMWLGSLPLLACSATRVGATDAELANARTRAAEGAAVFAQHCEGCHGEHGEGLAGAPAVMGPGALPEYPRDSSSPSAYTITDPMQLQILDQTRPAGAAWRDPFRSAQNLYDFTCQHATTTRVALTPDDCWALVTFLIAVQGGATPSDGINAQNGYAIQVPNH